MSLMSKYTCLSANIKAFTHIDDEYINTKTIGIQISTDSAKTSFAEALKLVRNGCERSS